jgi:hypothetical protein
MGSIRQPWIERRSLTQEDYKHMRLPAAYHSCQLKTLPYEARRQIILNYINELKENADDGKGVLFYGDSVRYRTETAVAVLKAFKAHGQSCMYMNFDEFKLESRRSFFADNDTELMKRAQTVQILLVDEVREGGDTTILSSLDALVSRRTGERLVTLITTKAQPNQWMRAYPEHLRAWLSERSIQVEYSNAQIQGVRDERRSSNG